MPNIVCIPGFALSKAMYSRLELQDPASCIDIEVGDTWNSTIESISSNLKNKSILIGYSLGSRLALSLALTNPEQVSGLVLISTHAGLFDDEDRTKRINSDDQLAEYFRKDKDHAFLDFDKNDIFDQSALSPIENLERLGDPEKIAKQLNVLGLGRMPILEDRLQELRVPVLYLTGTRDPKFTSLNARYKKKTPFSHHRIIDSDHRLVHSNPHCTSLNIKWFTNQFF